MEKGGRRGSRLEAVEFTSPLDGFTVRVTVGRRTLVGIARSCWYFTAVDTPHSWASLGCPLTLQALKMLLPMTRSKFRLQREGPGSQPYPVCSLLALRLGERPKTDVVAGASP